MKPRNSFVLSAFLTLSCLRPTEERVELDLRVGQAETGALSVNVKDGLATVRSLSDNALVLWGSAPSFEVDLIASSTLPGSATFGLSTSTSQLPRPYGATSGSVTPSGESRSRIVSIDWSSVDCASVRIAPAFIVIFKLPSGFEPTS